MPPNCYTARPVPSAHRRAGPRCRAAAPARCARRCSSSGADGLGVPGHQPCFIGRTRRTELRIEVGEITGLRNWYPVIAAEGAHLAFDAAPLVPLAGRAKL